MIYAKILRFQLTVIPENSDGDIIMFLIESGMQGVAVLNLTIGERKGSVVINGILAQSNLETRDFHIVVLVFLCGVQILGEWNLRD